MNYWDNSRRHEERWTKVAEKAIKPYIFESNNFDVFVGFAEDWKSFGTIIKIDKSLDEKEDEEYLLEDKNSEEKYDGGCLLNEENIDLLQQKELIDELIFADVTKQGQFHVEEGDEVQPEELICETSIGVVEPYIFQTNKCCMNTRIISAKEGQFSNNVTEHGVDEVLIF